MNINNKRLLPAICVLSIFLAAWSNAEAQTCGWNIKFSGSVSSNPINKSGVLFVISPGIPLSGSSNGSNPFEVGMVLGKSPLTSFNDGDFQFATNTKLLGGTQQLDVASVGFNKKLQYPNYALQDPNLSATGLNIWIIRGMPYQAASGGINFKLLSGNNITGILSMTGRQSLGGGTSTYKGNFNGYFIGCE